MGPVSLYDGCLHGDGGEQGHFIGVMFSDELARRVVVAVNNRNQQSDRRLAAAAQAVANAFGAKPSLYRAGPWPLKNAVLRELRAALLSLPEGEGESRTDG
jgi:hypothetical protein